MERMDCPPYQVQRPSIECTTDFHCLGCGIAEESRAYWRIHHEVVWTIQVRYRDIVHWFVVFNERCEGDFHTFFIHSFYSIILTGRQKLCMWPDCEADGSEFTKTPSDTGERDEMDRFEKVSLQYPLLKSKRHHSLIWLFIMCNLIAV